MTEEAPLEPPGATFTALAASSPDGICTTDRDGRITFVNDTLGHLVGFDPVDLVGRSVFDFLVEDVRDAWHELATQGAPLPDLGEFELVCRDGTRAPVMLGITPLGSARFEGVLAVVRDISERRRTQQALADREAMLSTLLDNVPGMVYRCEPTRGWPMQFVSEGAERLVGWSAEELVADPYLYGSLIDPVDVPAIEAAIDAAIERGDGGPFAVRYRLRHRDGSLRWIWERGRVQDGATLQGLAIDITRQVEDARALVESEQRYRRLIETLPGGVVVTRRGTVVFASATAAQLLGIALDQLEGAPILSLLSLSDEDRDRANEIANLTERLGVDAPPARFHLRTPDGTRELAALSTPATYRGDAVTQTFFWDVTADERVAALQAAQRSVLEALADGRQLREVLSTIVHAVEGADPSHRCCVLLVDDQPRVTDVVHSSLPQEALEAVLAETSLAGSTRALQALFPSCSVVTVGGDGGAPVAALALLASADTAPTAEQAAIHEHFRHLIGVAFAHDRLRRPALDDRDTDVETGLTSRAQALRLIEARLAEPRTDAHDRSLAVLLIALDDVASITDALGADVTNEIVGAVARVVSAHADDGDLVARFGPTTFLVATYASSDDDVDSLAQRIQSAVAASFRAGGHEVFMTASVGIAMSSGVRDTAASLLANADVALYQAMNAGPAGQRRFDERLRRQAARRVKLEPALARAITEDEFFLVYQPQVDLATGVVVGLEALLRWRHPTEGLVPPGDFIPLAERNGLVVPIGSWVLEQACRQAAAWRDVRPERPPFVSVNLSARQLADPGLIRRVEAALAATRLEPALLRLELTETAVMADPASATVILRDLRSLGVRLSIDDFGTGYSSLVYLKRFPVDELKIDRAFVDGVGERGDDTAIVAAVVKLAESLGLSTLAEGVERAEQAQELRRLGCDLAQGYYWARPSPAADLRDLIRRGVDPVPTVDAPGGAEQRHAGPDDVDAALVALVHEARGPLTMIKGFAELLDSPVPPPTALPAIRRGADRLARVIQSVDDVNSIDRGTIHLERREEKLLDVVRSIVAETTANRPTAVITIESSGDDLVAVFDRTRIEQVIANLLTNALRYGPADGPVRIVCTATADELRCSVIDAGPGLPAEDAGGLFRKYARGDRTQPGSGLGLYLSRGLARAHGGDLAYRRADTGGAEFVLTLPKS